jgi:antirestriction protein ArdC
MKRDLYAEVSTRIVAELEAGAAPWVKPWSATAGMNTPCNAVTNRPYSGCNVLLLWMAQTAGYRTPRFLTFKQALQLGGNVRKGECGTKVYFVKRLQVRDKGGHGEAFYVPSRDFISMPAFDAFKGADHFYNVAFHELTHWSGHKSRLDRNLTNRFGARNYAAEELIAELGAALLCAEFGFDGDVRNAGYITSWIELLKTDKRAFFTACSNASKAADYLRGLALAEPAEIAA